MIQKGTGLELLKGTSPAPRQPDLMISLKDEGETERRFLKRPTSIEG